MNTAASVSRLFCITLLAGAGIQADPVDVGVTGNLYVAGNTASFGTEGVADPGYTLEYVPASDAVWFSATSSSATWLWRQGLTGSQMQLSSANVLSLFNPGTSTPGLALAPNGLSLQGTTSDVFGIQTIAIDGNSSQVRLIVGDNALQTGETDRLTIGATDFSTGIWYPRFTVRATGNVGVGTETPGEKLEVVGNLKVTGGTITTPSVTLPDGSTLTTARTTTLYNAAGTAVASVATDGKVNFINGLSVGTGGSPATITPNSAAYLNQTLANLGFREGVTATPIKTTIPYTGDISIRAIAADASFVYVAGACTGDATIGGVSRGGGGVFIAKLDLTGVAQWVRSIHASSGSITINAIAVDSSGNVLAAGQFRGTTTGLTSPANNLTATGNGDDALVVKYNSSGASQWARRVGGNGSDFFKSLAVDSSGNVLAAGYCSGTTTGLTSPAINVSSNGSWQDAFVVKYDSSGASQWAQRVGGTGSDFFESVAVDGSGNVVAVGFFGGTTTGLSSPANNLSTNGGFDAFVVKYDSSGASQWAQRVGGPGSSDVFTSVAVDGSGNVVAAGSFAGTTTGLSGPANNLTANGSSTDALVVKYNSSGASQWARSLGTSAAFRSVALDGSGNVVVAGSFTGTTTGLSSPASNLTSNGVESSGLLIKYDSAGNSQTSDKFGGASSSSFDRISLVGANIWMIGTTGGVREFGDSRLFPGPFAIGWSGLPVVTPTAGSPAALAWGGGMANNAGVALGSSAYASAPGSAALGSSRAVAQNSFATGTSLANGSSSTAMGDGSVATGDGATAMGVGSVATGDGATAMGTGTTASGIVATAMGEITTASGSGATAMGVGTTASGDFATAMGEITTASGPWSTAMGMSTIASGDGSTAMGLGTTASGSYGATAMGSYTSASGDSSTAMGEVTSASGRASFAIGEGSVASGSLATAMGQNTLASGGEAIAVGIYTTADGGASIAAGDNTIASGYAAIAMGGSTAAGGDFSTATGANTIAAGYATTVLGQYNVPQGNPTEWIETDDVFVIGNGGTNETLQRNALAVHKNGNMRVQGTVQAKGGFRTPPMGDIGMGTFTSGPAPAGQTTDGSSNPDNLGDGLRFPGE